MNTYGFDIEQQRNLESVLQDFHLGGSATYLTLESFREAGSSALLSFQDEMDILSSLPNDQFTTYQTTSGKVSAPSSRIRYLQARIQGGAHPARAPPIFR